MRGRLREIQGISAGGIVNSLAMRMLTKAEGGVPIDPDAP